MLFDSVISRISIRKATAACFLLLAVARFSPAASTIRAVPTTARNLRSEKIADPDHRVTVQGVITAFSGWKNSFFLQDDTGAISVDRLEQTAVRVGDEVEITGTARPGLFAPILLSETIRVLGRRALPKARAVTYLELSSGNLDSSQVEVTGIIHSAHVGEMWGKPVLLLDLRTLDGGNLTVHVLDLPTRDLRELVDSTVVVRGVCGTVFNSRQQVVGVRLFVPGLGQIERELAPVEQFRVPLSSLSSLLRFHPDMALQHRVRVAGTVTYQAPGSLLYLQSDELGLGVRTGRQDVFPLGAQVEAFGFVAADGYSATMDDANVRMISSGPPLQPLPVAAAQVISTKDGFTFAPYDGVLVQVAGKIVERLPRARSQLWLVEDQQVQFQAELGQPDLGDGRIEPGALVRMTGVCRIEADNRSNPKSFRILLRSADDLAIVRTASSSILILSAVVAILVLLGAGFFLLWREGRSGRPAGTLADHAISDSRLLAFARASKIMAALAGTLAALVLFGWAANIQVLKSIRPGFPNMKPNGALCLLALSVAVWLAHDPRRRLGPIVARALAGFAALVGGLTLVEYFSGWNLHIDQALFAESGLLLFPASPGRMALVTALCFVLLGFALVALRQPRLTGLAQAAALLTGSLCLLGVNSYLYGIHRFEGIGAYAGAAVHTSCGILLLSLAILFCCPSRGVMRAIAMPAPGGVMALRLLPRVLLLPSVLGWIRWQGQLLGYYDTAFGLALFTTINAICFVFLIWSTASLLNRLDQTRLQADAEVRLLNDTLEARVAERTAELRESEQRFRSTIDAVKDYSIITLDADGHVTTWNSGAERQKGYRADEILGKHFSTFYSEEDQKNGVAQHELAVARSSGECRQEGWRLRKDGRRFWASVLITSVWNDDGSLRGFSKITQDITEQMRAQERFRLVVEAAPNAVMMVDSDGRMTLVNRQAERLFGYQREELIGQPLEMLVPERLRRQHEGHRGAFFAHPDTRAMNGSRELSGLRRDGSEVPIEVGLNPVITSEGSFVLASITDITERKKAQKMLRDQAMIIDLASDTVFIRDSEGRITYWNQGAERLYGWTRDEVLGKGAHQLLKTQFPLPLPELTAQLMSAGHWSGELIHTRRDGSQVTVASAWTLQRDDGNRLSAVLEMNYDITERKRAQTALKEAHHLLEMRVTELAQTNRELGRKNEEVEAFVYIVSHDLRAPLVNLQGFAKELEMSCDELRENLLPVLLTLADEEAGSRTALRVQTTLADRMQAILQEEIPDSLRYITASTTKFRRLIDALLEFSRYGRQAHRPEELDLDATVQTTLDLMRLSIAASGARMSVSPLPRVRGDATAIGQVFSNLIGNSLKYLQPGRPGQIEIGGERESGVVHCWVRDNGAGLPPSAKARLFQVFQRFHPQLAPGEGMGLAIVKRIIERHGGRIWAEGEEGVGTTFHFTLSDG